MGCFIYNILYLSPVEAIKQKTISDSQKTKKGEKRLKGKIKTILKEQLKFYEN